MTKNNFLKSTPIFLAFLVMGFGDVSGPLTSQLQTDFSLNNFQAGLVTFMAFIMFGLLSIPMGLYQDRKGRKHVLMLGLIAALVGMILPIIGNYESFVLILGGLLFLGTGATMLQVAGNPIMRDVSPEGKYSRNLSFGQFVKAIGSLSGSLIPILAARYWGLDWKLLFPIYGSVMLVVIVILLLTKIEEQAVSEKPATLKSCFGLLKNPYVLLMVIGIFLYVGSEVSMSAKLPNFLEAKFDYDIKEKGLIGTLFFFISLMTGRFLGGVILNWLSPKRFLIITSILSIVGIAGLFIASSQVLAFIFIFIVGLGFANIFPLIFSMTVDTMPERSNEISGLMVTAIIGGAFVPILFGVVADMAGLMAGFIVPGLCMVYILLVANRTSKA
ncbi:MAG: sugar MFS transporter [Bacteroidetes bacterium]|nr:sugar MFS transporter [Bacteroidota bacterium]